MNRSGAALIIALVILAALLLLGLPFLFTQSASLAGTRAFAHAQQAHIGRDTAENTGVAAAASALSYHLKQDGVLVAGSPIKDDWTSLYWGLGGANAPEAHLLGENRVGLDLSPNAMFNLNVQPTNTALLGVTIADEAGKLDPNHLDALAWATLFKQVGIVDWDDGSGTSPDPANQRLAVALAGARFDPAICPSGRLTTLEQLLQPVPTPSGVARQRLTRGELEQLRPYLSLANRAQARAGLIDVGTIIATNGSEAVIDSLPPGELLAVAVTPSLAGAGTTLVTEDNTGATHVVAANTLDQYGALAADRPIAIDAPPSVNLHQTTAAVRMVLDNIQAPRTPVAATPSVPLPDTLAGNTGLTSLTPPPMPVPLFPADAGFPLIPGSIPPKKFGFELLNPLAITLDLGQSRPQASRASDPGGNSAPLNLAGDPVDGAGKPVLTAEAQTIRIVGGPLARLGSAGYARIEGTDSSSGLPVWEFIFYRSGLPTNASNATLNVTRGITVPDAGPSSAHRYEADATLKLTFFGAHELPPLAIASQGIVAIEASSTVNDAAGRQDAQQTRRIVAQTINQEDAIESRWEKQAQLQALLAARHGSLLTTFPRPYPRLSDIFPEDPPPSTAPDPATGLRPAVMRTLLNAGHLTHDWTRPFTGLAGSANDFLARGTPTSAAPPTSGAYTAADLTPEGLKLRGGASLSYPLAAGGAATGFLSHPNTTGAAVSIYGRQIGLWVKPDANWASAPDVITLLETRIPIAHAGLPFNPTGASANSSFDPRAAQGNTDEQNLWSFGYDPSARQMVVVIGNGAIEHPSDYGPACPGDDFYYAGSPYPALNRQCLGPSQAGAGTRPLAPARPLNHVEYRYQLANGLSSDTWHHLQVIFNGTRPGQIAVLVDGLAGKDAIQGTTISMSALGDHQLNPGLVLAAALPKTNPAALGAGALKAGDIALIGNAAAVLPARGMVRIGNEYISYEDIQGSTLKNCVRARRQNSNQLASNAIAAIRWPVTEDHAAGDLVVPGGYRFVPQSGKLYAGGCTLSQPLPDGDLTITPNQYHTWAYLDPSAYPQNVPAGTFAFDPTETSITLTGGMTASAFPPRGYVRIGGNEVAFYNAIAGNRLLVPAGGRWVTPGPTPSPQPTQTFTIAAPPTVQLISFEVTGADPTINNRYPLTGGLLQLYDADPLGTPSYRVEWLRYTHAVSTTLDPAGVGYFFLNLNANGFPASERGLERTAFAPRDLSGSDGAFIFPAGTRVIPVQSELPNPQVIAAGDVLTIAPKTLSAALLPYQAVVRYAATDGFSGNPAVLADPATPPTNWDTNNGWFAFSEALPQAYAANSYELLCWPCWSGTDLTVVAASQSAASVGELPPDLLPWGNDFATGFLTSGADDRRIYIGSEDDRPTHNPAPNPGADAVIDAIHAGNLSSPGVSDVTVSQIIAPAAVDVNGTWIAGTALADIAGLTIQANAPAFIGPSGGRYGLALIGGEVFAFKYHIDTSVSPAVSRADQADLIGRGLLGSTATVHRGQEAVLILPVGPVQELTAALAASAQGPLQMSGAIDAPTMLVSSADGRVMELLAAPNQYTAPWLRGLYNTAVPGTWTATASFNPIAIGWWPRYASAFPIPASATWTNLTPAQQAAMLRCRSYAWAGFPLRAYDSFFYFPNAIMGEVTVLDTALGAFTVTARALDSGFDWTAATALVPLPQSAFPTSFTSAISSANPFATSRFRDSAGTALAVDGAELRITWSYSAATLDPLTVGPAPFFDTLARNSNRAPTIGTVKLRCRAPAKIISVESAR